MGNERLLLGIIGVFGFFGISFFVAGGFWTPWVGGARRGFRKYPLTRNCYKNDSLRIIIRNFLRRFALSKCPGKKDIFKELRVRFVIFFENNYFKIIFRK